MRKKTIFILLGSVLLLWACRETKKEEAVKEKEETNVPKNDLQVRFEQLEDSTDLAWKQMMEADDQKIAYTKRLLDEISYTPRYNAALHARLVQKCNSLKNKRYTEENFTSEQIDRYDHATDSLLREVKELVINTPNIENYPLCSELLTDITNLDNDVVMKRVNYDNWAMKYNNLIGQHREELKALGTNDSELREKKTFQLEN